MARLAGAQSSPPFAAGRNWMGGMTSPLPRAGSRADPQRNEPRRPSLPLDRGGGLARKIVRDARNAVHFVDDAPGDELEKLIRQTRPARRHEVDGFDRTQRDHVVVTTTVAHHGNRAHGQKYCKRLAGAVIEIVL